MKPGRRGRKAKPILFVPGSADPGGDVRPTPERRFLRLEDAIANFTEVREGEIRRDLVNMKGMPDRQEALRRRVPDPPSAAQRKTRRNILKALELVDIVEQTLIVDDIIDELSTLEDRIHREMIGLVQDGCTVETLTGLSMTLPERRSAGPASPAVAARIFRNQCEEMAFLHGALVRVSSLSDTAEAEGQKWGTRLKTFDKRVNFRDRGAPRFFASMGRWIEEKEVGRTKERMKTIREEHLMEEIAAIQNQIDELSRMERRRRRPTSLEEKEELEALEEKLEKLETDLETMMMLREN